jgi:hypothetical protein
MERIFAYMISQTQVFLSSTPKLTMGQYLGVCRGLPQNAQRGPNNATAKAAQQGFQGIIIITMPVPVSTIVSRSLIGQRLFL